MENTILLVKLISVLEETEMIVGVCYSKQSALDMGKEMFERMKGIILFDVLSIQEIEIMKTYTYQTQPGKEFFPTALLI